MAKTAKIQTLKATTRKRTGSGLLKQMRREGFIPSVIYGNATENLNIKVEAKTLKDMLQASASDSILVNLDIEGHGTQLAFLQDVQHDPVYNTIIHVDFWAVSDDTLITANLPLELVGEAQGVKAGGLLEQMIYNLEVTCLPKDLPALVEADVTSLEVSQMLYVGDVKFPKGVTPTLNEKVVVALVAKTRTAKSAEAGAKPDKAGKKAAK